MSGLRERNRRTAMAEVQRTAMAMMQASGFSNVTVEEIAGASGVSASTVYRYFGTKEALVLWGDRATTMVTAFADAAAKGETLSVEEVFVSVATAAYDDADVVAQLALVFGNPELTVAFEHELIGQRGPLARALADRRTAKSTGWRDVAAAGSMLGTLIAVLERWSSTGGDKALGKQLAKVFDIAR